MNLKYLLLLLTILIAAISCENTEEPEPEEYTDTSPKGTVIADDLINSETLGGPQHYAIYLPPGYDTSSIEFPVMYLLHGMWGSYKDWSSHGMAGIVNDLIAWESAKPMVIAIPDGLDAFYCNNYNGGDLLYEDYFIDEFIPYIESNYRIRAATTGPSGWNAFRKHLQKQAVFLIRMQFPYFVFGVFIKMYSVKQ